MVGEDTIPKRILLAADGSDQALDAIRYIGHLVDPSQYELVLFNVGNEFPEVYWDLEKNPLYQSKKNEVRGWLAENQTAMGEFMEKALKILKDAGFPMEAVKMKAQPRHTGVVSDILEESHHDYAAVVVGRSGQSRVKDLLLGSVASKLVDKIKHIPTITVGGRPTSDKIMVAMDDTIQAMRAVHNVGLMVGGPKAPRIDLCHLVLPRSDKTLILNDSGKEPETEALLSYEMNKFAPVMEEAVRRLVETGVPADRITQRCVLSKGDPVMEMMTEARKEAFGTIVVGRREAIGFLETVFTGRFSEKVIRAAGHMAVWVVS